jgi:hypothetical protein
VCRELAKAQFGPTVELPIILRIMYIMLNNRYSDLKGRTMVDVQGSAGTDYLLPATEIAAIDLQDRAGGETRC